MVKRILPFLSVVLLLIPVSVLSKERNLLANSISEQELQRALNSSENWPTTPKYSDRAAWEAIPDSVRQHYIGAGEGSLDFAWGIIPAMSYMEFTRSGDRRTMEIPSEARTINLRNLILAELMEGKGRFIEPIINGIWAICEQSTWVASAHLPAQKGGAGLPNPDDTIIDLSSSRIGALMSWAHYFFRDSFDKVSPHVSERIRREVRKKVLEPYYNRENFFWQGFNNATVNNWNPYCNYHILESILLIETDPKLRSEKTMKVMRSLDKFINGYPEDGGCDEGPSYWTMSGAKMFESLEILQSATGGKVDIFDNPTIKNIGKYPYRAYIGNDYVTNFADAPVTIRFDPGILFRYGKAIGDTNLMEFGGWAAQQQALNGVFGGSLEYVLMNLFNSSEMQSCKGVEPLVGESWFPDTQLVMARETEGSKQGFYFAAKGGHNQESHNHNDVGNFILYYNASPVIIDVGVGTYMRQTFSRERYSIWNMRSLYHNVPIINGVEQSYGRRFAARNLKYGATSKQIEFSLDIAGGYPQTAAVNHWDRSYLLERGGGFRITDSWSLNKNMGDNVLVFMTPCEISTPSKGVVTLQGEGFVLRLSYNPNALSIETEQIPILDPRIKGAWGESITRICLTIKSKSLRGSTTINITREK